MISQYFEAAMTTALLEIKEDGRYYGEIPTMPGVWAEGGTLEECRSQLFEVMEEWTLMAFWLHTPLPIIGAIDANLKMELETDSNETAGADPQASKPGISRTVQGSEASLHGQG